MEAIAKLLYPALHCSKVGSTVGVKESCTVQLIRQSSARPVPRLQHACGCLEMTSSSNTPAVPRDSPLTLRADDWFINLKRRLRKSRTEAWACRSSADCKPLHKDSEAVAPCLSRTLSWFEHLSGFDSPAKDSLVAGGPGCAHAIPRKFSACSVTGIGNTSLNVCSNTPCARLEFVGPKVLTGAVRGTASTVKLCWFFFPDHVKDLHLKDLDPW